MGMQANPGDGDKKIRISSEPARRPASYLLIVLGITYFYTVSTCCFNPRTSVATLRVLLLLSLLLGSPSISLALDLVLYEPMKLCSWFI
jgi:hypothetical protein